MRRRVLAPRASFFVGLLLLMLMLMLMFTTDEAAASVVTKDTSTIRHQGSASFRARHLLQRSAAATTTAKDVSCPTTTTTTTTGLPMGDINVLVVTDIHGWIAGQHARHEPELNVDFGDLVSLYERLQACASDGGGDWFLLFNGCVRTFRFVKRIVNSASSFRILTLSHIHYPLV